MSAPLVIARSVMRTVHWIVPRERSEWLAAMVGEFSEIQSPHAALSWAAGCLVAALGWRLRDELPYATAAVCAWSASTAAYLAWWWLTPPQSNLIWVTLAQQVAIVCATLGLSLTFPRRALLSGIVIVMSSSFGALPRFVVHVMESAGTREAAVSLAWPMALFVAENSWPALLTAFAVWGWAKGKTASAGR